MTSRAGRPWVRITDHTMQWDIDLLISTIVDDWPFIFVNSALHQAPMVHV